MIHRDSQLYPALNLIGFAGAYVFAALVILPMIVFFVVVAVMELAATGGWQQANRKSRAMGKSFERPIWYLRSLGGRLPIEPPAPS